MITKFEIKTEMLDYMNRAYMQLVNNVAKLYFKWEIYKDNPVNEELNNYIIWE